MEKVNNSLVKTEKKESFSDFMTKPVIQNRIRAMMSGSKGDQFITSVVSAVTANPALAECDKMSVFSAALLGAGLQLSPSPQLGQFYMVPFKQKKKQVNGKWVDQPKKAEFVCGYKGYIQLAIRSGQYRRINVLAIKDGELLDWNPLTEDIEVKLLLSEKERENAKTIGYYAMFEYMNGFRKALYWSLEKMQLHADRYSPAFDLAVYLKMQAGEKVEDEWKYSSFWYKDFDSMGLKTMIRQLISKWGIMSIEMEKALQVDVESENNSVESYPEPEMNQAENIEDEFFND